MRHASNLTFFGEGLTCITECKWNNLTASGGYGQEKLTLLRYCIPQLHPQPRRQQQIMLQAAPSPSGELKPW